MSVLVDSEIQELTNSKNLIEQFDQSSLEGASYDLRLGSSYMRQGVIKSMTAGQPSIAIQPGEYVIITSHESLNFPLDLVAHFGLMSPWGMKGIVSLFGPQIDPGFSGILVVPIFNAGDSPVTLPFQEKMFTVEFLRTNKEAREGWAEKHQKQTRIKALHTAFQSRPNLADVKDMKENLDTINLTIDTLKAQVEANKGHIGHLRESKNWYIAFWALVIAVVALFVGILSSSYVLDKFNGTKMEKKQSQPQVEKKVKTKAISCYKKTKMLQNTT